MGNKTKNFFSLKMNMFLFLAALCASLKVIIFAFCAKIVLNTKPHSTDSKWKHNERAYMFLRVACFDIITYIQCAPFIHIWISRIRYRILQERRKNALNTFWCKKIFPRFFLCDSCTSRVDFLCMLYFSRDAFS